MLKRTVCCSDIKDLIETKRNFLKVFDYLVLLETSRSSITSGAYVSTNV